MVPKGMLREWAAATFSSPTDYWTFRKMMTLQLSLASFAEYVLHLTRLNPDMMYVHQDSGLLNVSYFKFDIDDTTGTYLVIYTHGFWTNSLALDVLFLLLYCCVVRFRTITCFLDVG